MPECRQLVVEQNRAGSKSFRPGGGRGANQRLKSVMDSPISASGSWAPARQRSAGKAHVQANLVKHPLRCSMADQ
jgi:hypothetical protein